MIRQELDRMEDVIQADHATAAALAKLEPAMMVGLALFAGWIVIAIYMPMFTMYNLF